VVEDVVSAGTSFSLSIRLLTFDLEVEAAQGDSATSSVDTYLRKEKTPPETDC
jgi:orotate phosphoribosyltransferase